MKDKVIGPRKPKGVSKNPWELVKAHENAELGKGPKGRKESKWAKDTQKENGT